MTEGEHWTLARTSRALRDQWDAGRASFGAWATIGNSYVTELLATAGFHWIGIDMQHGLISSSQLPPMLQACAITRTPAFVRVAGHAPEHTLKALDAGANGVIVPMIDTAEEAAAAVAACRHPPHGIRSWGATRAPLRDGSYSVSTANEAVICAVMIETAKALENVASIVAVPGVDAIFVGPRDLTLSLEACGGGEAIRAKRPQSDLRAASGSEAADAELNRAILAVRDACRDANVVAGIYAGSATSALRWANEGFQLIALMSDGALLRDGARRLLAEVSEERGEISGRKPQQ